MRRKGEASHSHSSMWGAAEGGAVQPGADCRSGDGGLSWGRGGRYSLGSPTAGSHRGKLWGDKLCLSVNSNRQRLSYPPTDGLPQVIMNSLSLEVYKQKGTVYGM